MEIQGFFEKLREGEWVTVPGTDVQIHVVPSNPKQTRQQRDKYFKPAAGGSVKVDSAALYDCQLDMCVVGWKNIKMGGKDLPCTIENKRLLDDQWQAFSTCWQEAANRLGRLQTVAEAAVEKNS